MRDKVTVDWASLMAELTERLIRNLRKSTKAGTPLTPYVAHLYTRFDLLTSPE